MYQTINELPSQVRASLDEDDQEEWMKVYNSMDPKSAEQTLDATKKAWGACKDLPSSFSFCIIASVEDVDKDKEVIDVKSIEEGLDSYISYGGNVQFDHNNYTVGCIWDWEPITVDKKPGVRVWGNVFGGDQVYDQVRKKFKEEGVNSLSVAGEADKGKWQCDEKGCYTRRNVRQLMEISLCKVPSNDRAKMVWYNDNAKLTKSADSVLLRADSFIIHDDHDSCPILGLRKSLKDAGIEAHARKDGVHVPMTGEEFDMVKPFLDEFLYTPTDEGIIMKSATEEMKKEFESAYKSGYIDKDGYVTDKITKSEFSRMYEDGLINYDGLTFRFEDPSIFD